MTNIIIKFIFITPLTDRKDSHNLMKGSVALRVGTIPNDKIYEFNNFEEFDVADLESNDEKTKGKMRDTVKKMMAYVNGCCDDALKNNFKIKNRSNNNVKPADSTAFTKNKEIKLNY